MIYDVIIIGAGASGLFCASGFDIANRSITSGQARNASASTASEPNSHAFRGLILEKSKRPGRKLLMSGSGQCNITHAGSVKDFLICYGGHPGSANSDQVKAQKKYGSLLRSCLYRYNNLSLMEFLESCGVKTVTREDGKVFPASMEAREVLELLLRKVEENGFEIRYGNTVEQIKAVQSDTAEQSGAIHLPAVGKSLEPTHLWKVHTADSHYLTRALVIATGGCSYPTTGSDGSMFRILKRDLGIGVTPLKPALSSIQVKDYPYSALSGISFDPAGISIWRDGRRIAENTGALLFTHQDLSGPAVLNISKFAEAEDVLKINYVHPIRYEDALNRLRAATHGSKATLSGIIAADFHLPLRFCKVLTNRCGESLRSLARQLTDQEMIVASVSGFDKAMATSGGVELEQVNISTMALKAHPGIYVIGEALDVDGVTGGYNLQFAYSSGQAAACSICSR